MLMKKDKEKVINHTHVKWEWQRDTVEVNLAIPVITTMSTNGLYLPNKYTDYQREFCLNSTVWSL
jgi:hypothetical protein